MRTDCSNRGKIITTQLLIGVSMNRKERKEAAERLAAEIIELAKKRLPDNVLASEQSIPREN